MEPINRIHHISAIVGSSQENVAFYRNVLGLKLIKKTVNFDDPDVYHLYFTDQDDESDAIMTFFNWETGRIGRKGSGQVGRIAFRIPKGSLETWKERLRKEYISYEETTLFNRPTLEFQDVHALELALVEVDETSKKQHILGIHGAVLNSAVPEATVRLLTHHMGLKEIERDNDYVHLETIGEERHHIIVPTKKLDRGRWGVGTVHHIAWNVPNDEKHVEWQEYLMSQAYDVTEVKDRHYFKAIYMKELGGVIFEYATEGPGFTIDESSEKLGTNLMLPPMYEFKRDEIEAKLPPIN